jgi:hypothetical protein
LGFMQIGLDLVTSAIYKSLGFGSCATKRGEGFGSCAMNRGEGGATNRGEGP